MNSKKRFFLRKLTKVFACLTVALATLFMFAACSNGNVKTVYETKYEIIRETIDIEDLYTLYLTENPGATLEDFLLSL
jgi:hypothetical protein